jgi:arabinose-5-phosphate isomerase
MSKKDSILYNASDIKLLIPQVIESAGIVPTSSTTSQLALGDALAIAVMKKKKIWKIRF